MAGQPLRDPHGIELHPLQADATFDGDPESVRNAKHRIDVFLPRTQRYKPTTHQLALTRLLDFEVLRASGLPCFGTLERAVQFLLGAEKAGVYPPAGSAS
jgi:hypothetical protein